MAVCRMLLVLVGLVVGSVGWGITLTSLLAAEGGYGLQVLRDGVFSGIVCSTMPPWSGSGWVCLFANCNAGLRSQLVLDVTSEERTLFCPEGGVLHAGGGGDAGDYSEALFWVISDLLGEPVGVGVGFAGGGLIGVVECF